MPDVLSDADVGLEQVLSDADVGIEAKQSEVESSPLNLAVPRQPPSLEQLTTYGGGRKPLASYAETMESIRSGTETPAMQLAAPRPQLTEPRLDVPDIPINEKEAGFTEALTKESLNALIGVPKFFTSDAGILSLLSAKLSPRLTSAGFSADLLSSAWNQARQLYADWDTMTPAQKGVATARLLSTTVFGGLAGTHAAGKIRIPGFDEAKPSADIEAATAHAKETPITEPAPQIDLTSATAQEPALPIERPTAPVIERPTAPTFESPTVPEVERPVQPERPPVTPSGKGRGPYRMVDGKLRDADGNVVDAEGNIIEARPEPTPEPTEKPSLPLPIPAAKEEPKPAEPAPVEAAVPVPEPTKALESTVKGIVYHGTASDALVSGQEQFVKGKPSPLGGAITEWGIFFSPKRSEAERYSLYAQDNFDLPAKVVEAKITLTNPKTMLFSDLIDLLKTKSAAQIKADAINAGHDGFILEHKKGESSEYAVFDPSQIEVVKQPPKPTEVKPESVTEPKYEKTTTANRSRSGSVLEIQTAQQGAKANKEVGKGIESQRRIETRRAISPTELVAAANWITRSPEESRLLSQLAEYGIPVYRFIDDIPNSGSLRYHGTLSQNIPSIISEGLTAGMSHNYESVKGVGGIGDVTFAFAGPDTRLGVLSARDQPHGKPIAIVINDNPASLKGGTIDYAFRKALESKETAAPASTQPAVESVPEGGRVEAQAEPVPTAAPTEAKTEPPPPQPSAGIEVKKQGAEGKKPFEVDDQLVMRSPHTGEDTIVSFRGIMPDGKAVVWTGKSQFPVPIEWLRRQGEKYEEQIPSKNQSVGSVSVEVAENKNLGQVPSESARPLPNLSKEELVDLYRKEVSLGGTTLRSALLKKTLKSLRQDIENARINRQREAQELELTRQIEPEIRKLADDAGSAWRTALNKYAKDRGWSFNPPSDTTKGEYVAMLALEQAKKQLKQSTTTPTPGPGAQTVGETQAPQIQGMGGATPAEFVKGQGSPTAMKYRLIDQERQKRGLEPLAKPDRISDQAVMDKAIAAMDQNPNLPDQLILELRAKPRAIEDWENHVLLLRKIELREEYHKAAREAMQAYADSTQFPERLADMEAANARTQFYSEKLTELEEASRVAGSARGRALRALRVMANEDFSLASLEMEKRAANNWRPLTPDERAELIKIADEHKAKSEELQKRLDELEKAQQDKEVGTVLTNLKSEVAKNPKAAATPVDISAAKIRQRLSKNPNADIRFFVRKIARYFVSQGTKERDVLIDQVHGVLSDIIPDLEKRTTADLISGYGDYSRLPKDTVSVILRDLSGQMQQISKLEDMMSGKAPLRSGQERRTPSDVERILQKQVEEQKKKGGYEVTDPELQLRTAQEAVQKRLQNQITDLELQIQTRQKIIKNPTKLQYDAKSNQLKARRDELKAVYDEIFAKPAKTEAERLAEWKERTKDRIDELKEFIAGTKQPKQKPTPVVLDKEALRIRFDLHTIERLWREKIAKEKRDQWTRWQKAKTIPAEVLNTSRALLTSFDFSAPGRQGIIIGLAHPLRAASALRPMFEAWRSERGAFNAAEQIRNRDNAPLYEIGKLYLAEHGGRLSKQEEAYMSRWASKIPGIRASERAYVTFLNRLRADSFDSMVEGLTANGVANPAELKAIANFINVATGRGVGLERSGTTLNTIFFAPRYVFSRFQFLAGQPLYKGTAATRKAIAKEYGKFLAGAAVVYSLAASSGAEVGTDPRSSDFGKIIIGNTRIDPMAGLNQVSTLVGRTVSGESKPLKGRAYPIVGKVPYGKSNLLDVMMNFGRSKLSPAIGTGISLRLGKDVANQPFGVSDLPKSMGVPISWQDMYSAMREEGVPAGIAMGMLSIFGIGVNTYEQQNRR